jgi:hypothetical protein
MSGPLILLGQLLGTSFAAGLSLYATVAALGLAARLGWIPPLPPELAGLSHVLVIATAALLFLVEFLVDKIRYADSLWDTLHTFIRPPAAALLGAALLGELPLEARLLGAALAGAAAFVAHGTKAGLRLAIHASTLKRAGPAVSLAEDIAACGLVILAMRSPTAALALATGWLVLAALFGPRLWRAFIFGLRALLAHGRGFLSPGRWRERHELPPSLRALLPAPDLGAAPPRATRAAISGLDGLGAYRNGWLVITPAGPVFLYRTLLGSRSVALPRTAGARVRHGVLADIVQLDLRGRRCTLYLLKDGPPVELAIADLS